MRYAVPGSIEIAEWKSIDDRGPDAAPESAQQPAEATPAVPTAASEPPAP